MEKYKPKNLRVSTVARDLDVTTRTVRQWIHDKKIPGVFKLNGSWRVPSAWLIQYVENLKNQKIEEILDNSERNKMEDSGNLRKRPNLQK